MNTGSQDYYMRDLRPPTPEATKEAEREELLKRFTYHPPKGDQPARYTTLRETAKDFAQWILSCCPESRERALALTKLEEAVMWANAAIARNE